MRFLFAIVALLLTSSAYSQSNPTWSTPAHQIKYGDEAGKQTNLNIDQGYRFADLKSESTELRFFYNKDAQSIHNARIVDKQTNEEIARGKGSYFFGTARFEFKDGETIKLKRKRNANGYEIIGPYGVLFNVKNQGIGYAKTYGEKDFLLQAFYVFDRVKETLSPSDEYYQVYTTSYYSSN
ncbi:hypothetical protein [Algoriphagus aquimarinus]|uniref:Uncharacterized protein n=1 Tax=Algoriphagus aquimarinus TaxID=237018 RepID=A0A5C7ATW2_9BACT|nr:hypothetical protein [Algoriphagus aquimarinus]TXE12176.1 hypothetical protein ESV85_09025 [Algoriphagus aquimarinus]